MSVRLSVNDFASRVSLYIEINQNTFKPG